MSNRRRSSRKPIAAPPKPILFLPFGVTGAKELVAKCNAEKCSAEDALLAVVISHLKLTHYTDKDIEWVLENDDLSDQVNTWVERNRRMLTLGQGGVYAALEFTVSPPEVVDS